MSADAWELWLGAAAKVRQAHALERSLRCYQRTDARTFSFEDREYLSFLSNDYLGLATHPALIAAAQEAIGRFGVGASASRLISGTSPEHAALESELANFLKMPACLVFTSGFHANIGVITSLADRETLVVSDALNHATIIDGARLARAGVAVFRHRDYAHAAELIASAGDKRVLIVSDGLFSIDGDLADWQQLDALARKSGALLLIDDAHAIGVLGEQGRGSAELAGLELGAHCLLGGTFSKGLGSLGGFLACSGQLREHFVNHARSLIFSTAGDIAAQAASRAALKIVASPEGQRLRTAVLARAQELRQGFAARAWESGGVGQIVPLWLGAPERATELAAALRRVGILVAAIRPPTVPAGRSMLRISLSALHTPADVDYLTEMLEAHL